MTVLSSFGGSGDGAVLPCAGLLDVKGALCRTTNVGQRERPWNDLFGSHYAGWNGNGGLQLKADRETANIRLLGADQREGASSSRHRPWDVATGLNNEGTVFSVTDPGKEGFLHSFKGGSGDSELPYADLVNVKGTLYGTTYAGGSGRRAAGGLC